MESKNKPKKKARCSVVTINGKEYVKIKRKVGKKRIADTGAWVTDYKEFYGETYKEACAKFEAYVAKQTESGGRCFGELIESWIENVFQLADYSDRTKKRYIDAFYYAFNGSPLLGQEIDTITGTQLQKVYNTATCGASTVKAANKLLRLFFQYCERENICKDITRSLITPKVEQKRKTQEIDVLTSEEITAILNGFEGHRLRLLIVLALKTGARISELLALQYSDITKDGIKIIRQLSHIQGEGFKVTKTKTAAAVRTVPISDSTLKEIQHHKKWHKREMLENGYRTEYLFTTDTGNHYFDGSLRTACNRVYDKIGVRRVGFHVYRHTFGSIMANKGVPIQTVAALMGHSDISITSRYYINVSANAKIEAVNALEF